MTSNTHSTELDKIAVAMVAAQQAIVPATKDKANPFFKSKYADLEAVWAACRDALHANGIAVIQGAMTLDGKPHMETKLIHVSGQWMTSFWELTPTKADPQAMGSAITYQRRYSLAAMVGVVTEDDDGNAAAGKAKKEEKPKEEKSNGVASYEIKPTKGWETWDQVMQRAIDKSASIETLTKLQMDNAAHLKAYGDKFETAQQALMQKFVTRMGDLSQGPVA